MLCRTFGIDARRLAGRPDVEHRDHQRPPDNNGHQQNDKARKADENALHHVFPSMVRLAGAAVPPLSFNDRAAPALSNRPIAPVRPARAFRPIT